LARVSVACQDVYYAARIVELFIRAHRDWVWNVPSESLDDSAPLIAITTAYA
jgi:hypothetical protein